jgi:ketosteroid isomerase-like protein
VTRQCIAAFFLLVCRPILAAPSEVDLAAAEAAVRKADADWSAAAGVDAWMAFYAADAIVFLPGDRLASGAEQVRDAVTRFLTPPRLSVSRHPIKVEMARSGGLAYLIGAYEIHFGDPRGVPGPDRGTRLELWKKQTDGGWKCTVDTWNSNEPAPQETPSASVQATSPEARTVPPPALPGTESRAAQVPASTYGDMPAHYEEAIRQYFQVHMKDPDSVQYQEITKPVKGYTTAVTGIVLMRETRNYGWTVKATINAKNSRGSYVGFKSYTFLFRGEKIVHTLAPLSEDEIN